jgi:hypothetical protein
MRPHCRRSLRRRPQMPAGAPISSIGASLSQLPAEHPVRAMQRPLVLRAAGHPNIASSRGRCVSNCEFVVVVIRRRDARTRPQPKRRRDRSSKDGKEFESLFGLEPPGRWPLEDAVGLAQSSGRMMGKCDLIITGGEASLNPRVCTGVDNAARGDEARRSFCPREPGRSLRPVDRAA